MSFLEKKATRKSIYISNFQFGLKTKSAFAGALEKSNTPAERRS